jgi:hypothetical protein
MAATNNSAPINLPVRLNKLEDQISILTAKVKSYQQTVSELKVTLAQRDARIQELELKPGLAQRSMLNKIARTLADCRTQLETGRDASQTAPYVDLLQQWFQTAQALFDEFRKLLWAFKTTVDNNILTAWHKLTDSRDPARPGLQTAIAAILGRTGQTGEILTNALSAIRETLPGTLEATLNAYIIGPYHQLMKRAITNTPFSMEFVERVIAFVMDILRQALYEISTQLKKRLA